MSFLEEVFNFGSELEERQPELVKILDEMYRQIAEAVNRKPDVVFRNTSPTSSDYRYRQGTFWLDQSAAKLYILDSKTNPSTASWTALN